MSFNTNKKALIESAKSVGLIIGEDISDTVVSDIAMRIGDNIDRISEDKRRELMIKASEMYKGREFDDGTSVGIVAAQSIAEPVTQMNFNTFHYAGVANMAVTRGLSRLIEIIDARRMPTTPMMIIPIEDKVLKNNELHVRQKLMEILYEIETTVLTDIAVIETDLTNMGLIIAPDECELYKRSITIEDIRCELDNYNLFRGRIISKDNKLYISSDTPSYKTILKMHEMAKNIKIKGIDGIRRAIVSKDEEIGGWVIITEGSNLREVMKIDGVDRNKVVSNNIIEVAEVLGIDAARNTIIREISDILKESGLSVDRRHIILLADMMTNDGVVKSVGRYGISGNKSSVLARAAFENTTTNIFWAAITGEIDKLQGPTENIIVGQTIKIGTGNVNIKTKSNKY